MYVRIQWGKHSQLHFAIEYLSIVYDQSKSLMLRWIVLQINDNFLFLVSFGAFRTTANLSTAFVSLQMEADLSQLVLMVR